MRKQSPHFRNRVCYAGPANASARSVGYDGSKDRVLRSLPAVGCSNEVPALKDFHPACPFACLTPGMDAPELDLLTLAPLSLLLSEEKVGVRNGWPRGLAWRIMRWHE